MASLVSLLDLLRGRTRALQDAVESGFEPQELFRPDENTPLGNGWLASSIELKRGLDVTEQPMDTLPGELLDAFFKR